MKKRLNEAWKDLAISAAIMCEIAIIAVIVKILVNPFFMKGATTKDFFLVLIIVFILINIREIKTIITGKISHPRKKN